MKAAGKLRRHLLRAEAELVAAYKLESAAYSKAFDDIMSQGATLKPRNALFRAGWRLGSLSQSMAVVRKIIGGGVTP